MMKLRAMIVDDEPLAHEIVLDYLTDLPFIELVNQSYSAIAALDYLAQHSVDLLILDINMPKLSGLELLKVMTAKPVVIITSAHKEFALESFELDVCDYLLKPYRYDRFVKAVNKAFQQYQLLQNAENNAQTGHKSSPIAGQQSSRNSLFIKVDKKMLQLTLADIVCFEAYGNYVKVWQQDKMHLTARTLSSFEQELVNDDSVFIRIHKSYLINKNHIRVIENNSIAMSNQQQLPIGKNFKHLAKLLLNKQG